MLESYDTVSSKYRPNFYANMKKQDNCITVYVTVAIWVSEYNYFHDEKILCLQIDSKNEVKFNHLALLSNIHIWCTSIFAISHLLSIMLFVTDYNFVHIIIIF